MDLNKPKSDYYNLALKEVNRLISWQDREPFSKTYGCFDRTYWGWKFSDFPGARFQEGVYPLAYLYCNPFPGNSLGGNRKVLNWALAGMRFWKQIQYPDGTFDEAYPYEHSLAATAFTCFYIGEAYLLLKKNIPQKDQNDLEITFRNAGNWLCKNDEHHGVLSNHLAAAAAALYVIYRISGEDKYQKRSQYFIQRIFDHQSDEGWYEEYGGADPGYQTHGTFYLARVWQYTHDPILMKSLQKSISFLTYCIHPNGTLGGEYGSRNTEFYFPAGFEILGKELPDAGAIAKFMRASVSKQVSAGLSAMDAYNFLPLFNNYLFAAENLKDLDSINSKLPCQQDGEKYFPGAGIFIKTTPSYYSVLGLSKGGVLKVYDRVTGELRKSNCGYWGRMENGVIISSQSLNKTGCWRRDDKGFTVKVKFVEVNQRIQTPFLFIGFRLFSLLLGRMQSAAFWVKNLLVHVLVRRRKEAPLSLTRRLFFEKNTISIVDRIELKGNVRLGLLYAGQKFSTIHMGSSRYFQLQELDIPDEKELDFAVELMRNGAVNIKHSIDFENKQTG